MSSAPRIAIPEPTSSQPDYNQRSWHQYADAVEACGAVAVPVPLSESPANVANLVASCSGVLLPGSPADVNPQKYGQEPVAECAPADSAREAVDELLLQNAFNLHKPLLCICYGTQSMNVWKGGTLAQHLTTSINHKAGREITEAHAIAIPATTERLKGLGSSVTVNSSHHQAVAIPGDGRKDMRSPPQDSGWGSAGRHCASRCRDGRDRYRRRRRYRTGPSSR